MIDNSFDSNFIIALEVFAEMRRVAPELPEDVGFSFADAAALDDMLGRLRELPDAAGIAAVRAALDWPASA